MCSFFYVFFIDKSFALRYSKIRFLNDEDISAVFEIKNFFMYFSIVATIAYIQLLIGCYCSGILLQSRMTLVCFFLGSFLPASMYLCALEFFKGLVNNIEVVHISELNDVIENNYNQFIDNNTDYETPYKKIIEASDLKDRYSSLLHSKSSIDIGALLTTAISIVSGTIAIVKTFIK